MSHNICVSVRVRPLNERERTNGSGIKVEQNSISLRTSQSGDKTFHFDHVFDQPSSQGVVYDTIGKKVLDAAFDGYNTCLFAYGQTGSGKTHTMLGSSEAPGIIPRLCRELYDRAHDLEQKSASSEEHYKSQVTITYFEIYEERVRNLLDQETAKNTNHANLKVREHPRTGPYIEGIGSKEVTSAQEIDQRMQEGNKQRMTAATNMNATSSRSHAVFQIQFRQSMHRDDAETGKTRVTSSRYSFINLVDLAGSERVKQSGVQGENLKEAASINLSLHCLGSVISKLAAGKGEHVPYRDSKLTWLLKESLGGNSKTYMMATCSPSSAYVDETINTLRYAATCKKIKTKAVVNEDKQAQKIAHLQSEVERLRAQLANGSPSKVDTVQRELEVNKQMMDELQNMYDRKLNEELVRRERELRERLLRELEDEKAASNTTDISQDEQSLRAQIAQFKLKEQENALLVNQQEERLNDLFEQQKEILSKKNEFEQAFSTARDHSIQSDYAYGAQIQQNETELQQCGKEIAEKNDEIVGLRMRIDEHKDRIHELQLNNKLLLQSLHAHHQLFSKFQGQLPEKAQSEYQAKLQKLWETLHKQTVTEIEHSERPGIHVAPPIPTATMTPSLIAIKTGKRDKMKAKLGLTVHHTKHHTTTQKPSQPQTVAASTVSGTAQNTNNNNPHASTTVAVDGSAATVVHSAPTPAPTRA